MAGENRVLLVDDEVAVLFAFRQVLKDAQTIIDTASSVEDAKNLLDQQTYNAVIADLRLTNTNSMDGYEVVSHARRVQPRCKIIVATAYGGDETRSTVLSLGADWYFEKPVSPRAVREKLVSLGAFSAIPT